MNDVKIGFIGGGNMATSLIGGLVAAGHERQQIWVADPLMTQRQTLQQQFGIHTESDNSAVVTQVDVLVFAVKPQHMRAVAMPLATTVNQRQPLILSIAAGVPAPDINRWLGGGCAIVRCMPNTPALLQCGATALFANERVSTEQRRIAETVLKTAGITVWVEQEALLDSVTALSGSGPAYFFLVMEAMIEAGVAMGLEAEQARLLTLQTALGAARMAMESDETPAVLRARVTSPGGTTERAVTILQTGNLETLFAEALQGARKRCQELSALLGDDE